VNGNGSSTFFFCLLQADEYDVLLTLWTVPLTKEAFGER